MSERSIYINTYDRIDNLFRILGRVFVPSDNSHIEVPGSLSLNLFNHFSSDGSRLKLREENDIILFKFRVVFEQGFSSKDLNYLLNEQENSFNTLAVRIQASCKKTKWCGPQKRLTLADINKKDEIEIQIPLTETKESISISYFLTREVEARKITPGKAFKPYSILSSGEEIKLLIDEVKELGANHFPIYPKTGLGDLLFKIEGLDKSVIMPQIYYAEELKEFFNQDNSGIVNCTFLMFSLYVLEIYLRWLVFVSNYEENDKDYKSLLELFSGYCQVSKTRISEIVNMPKHSPEQTMEYLSLSNSLFIGVQNGKTLNFKKEIRSLLKEEVKLKSYETVQNVN